MFYFETQKKCAVNIVFVLFLKSKICVNIVSCCDGQFGSIFFICNMYIFYAGLYIFLSLSKFKWRKGNPVQLYITVYLSRILAKHIENRIEQILPMEYCRRFRSCLYSC